MEIPKKIHGIKVNQWIPRWDKVYCYDQPYRKKPDPFFYIFSIEARIMKKLTGIYRRSTMSHKKRSEDLGIQRQHQEERSLEIRNFVRYGYPVSEISENKRLSGKFEDLIKPGWLPTSIVVNILKKGDKRRDIIIEDQDLITIEKISDDLICLQLPHNFSLKWEYTSIPPIEVIDGQHRLWAFDELSEIENFELPIVAYHGLDISWQAYLFWMINIKPKRINSSLAFDLYPLLRTEDWLDKFEGHSIYKETRAQEIVEALWGHELSPWYEKINMLGDRGKKQKMVSQASWIRSLLHTYIKSYEGPGITLGGLFGAPIGTHKLALPWSASQQVAFIIEIGNSLKNNIEKNHPEWIEKLREEKEDDLLEKAFYGKSSMINTDIGLRGLLYVTNDFFYEKSDDILLYKWKMDNNHRASDEKAVTEAIDSIRKTDIYNYVKDITYTISKFDWRSSSAPNLTDEEKTLRLTYRGSSGYREIRKNLLEFFINNDNKFGNTFRIIYDKLGFQ
jgi:DGQHR domain-containing protein